MSKNPDREGMTVVNPVLSIDSSGPLVDDFRADPAASDTLANPTLAATVPSARLPEATDLLAGSTEPGFPLASLPGNVEATGLVSEDNPITQRLDLDQQDELMKLRAQQAAVLKTRFAPHVVVMFTDVVGSTAYYETHGDFMGRQKMLTHNALLFPIVTAHGGSVIKTIGDAIMACFSAPDAALAAAASMQRALADFNQASPSRDEEIHVRIGLNSGPAIAEGIDLHGDVVNVASRLVAQARADEVVLTEALAAEVGRWSLKSLGAVPLKGKREPVRLFRLQWRDQVTDRAELPAALAGPSALPADYRIRLTLGRGPLGAVYLADDARSGKSVAIKVLHPHVAGSPSARQRIHEQLWTLTRLDHPGVIRVLEYACPPTGEIYFVTDYVDGVDLSELVARHGIPPLHEIAFIGHRLAEVLSYAHKQGVAHGDLKPENVLLDKNGRVHLRDFGLFRAWTSMLTESATPLGNPAYLAPELLTGTAAEPRSDVYSLGALLYFLASGRPPFEGGATMQTLTAVAAGETTPLGRVKPQVAPELVTIVDKAMAVHPGRRYTTPALMMPRLKQLVGGDAARAPQTLTHSIVDASARRTAPAARGRGLATTTKLRLGLIALVEGSPALAVTLGLLLILALTLSAVFWVYTAARVESSTLLSPGVVASAISLTTEAGAEVYLDGKRLGRTPAVRELAVAPGQHQVRIVHPSFEPYAATVLVQPGETLRLKVSLRRR